MNLPNSEVLDYLFMFDFSTFLQLTSTVSKINLFRRFLNYTNQLTPYFTDSTLGRQSKRLDIDGRLLILRPAVIIRLNNSF
jgi:hypothetical protein